MNDNFMIVVFKWELHRLHDMASALFVQLQLSSFLFGGNIITHCLWAVSQMEVWNTSHEYVKHSTWCVMLHCSREFLQTEGGLDDRHQKPHICFDM